MEKGDCDLNKILQNYTTNLPLYSLVNILYQMLQAVNYIHQKWGNSLGSEASQLPDGQRAIEAH